MKDKRYHGQKARYVKLPHGTVYYIFENNDPLYKELGRKQFLGAYVHTVVRDDIPVLMTNSLKETMEIIVKLADTLEKFGFNSLQKNCSLEETQLAKKKPKGKEIYKYQLCCFPGISMKKATDIMQSYTNMTDLISSLQTNTCKVKGIGKQLIQNMKEGLLLNQTLSPPVIIIE